MKTIKKQWHKIWNENFYLNKMVLKHVRKMPETCLQDAQGWGEVGGGGQLPRTTLHTISIRLQNRLWIAHLETSELKGSKGT